MGRTNNKTEDIVDVVLIGAGIMSATLGVLLKELEPGITVEIFERHKNVYKNNYSILVIAIARTVNALTETILNIQWT